jgi:hypothetical protein
MSNRKEKKDMGREELSMFYKLMMLDPCELLLYSKHLSDYKCNEVKNAYVKAEQAFTEYREKVERRQTNGRN